MILRKGQSLPNTLFRNFANPIECDNGELTMYFFCNNMNMENEGYGEARAYFGGNKQNDHGFTITLVGEMVVLGNVAPQQIASVLAGHHNMAI